MVITKVDTAAATAAIETRAPLRGRAASVTTGVYWRTTGRP